MTDIVKNQKKRPASEECDESVRPSFVERAIEMKYARVFSKNDATLIHILNIVQHTLYARDIIGMASTTPLMYKEIPKMAKWMVTPTCVNLIGPLGCWHSSDTNHRCDEHLNKIKYTINPNVFVNCETLISISCIKCLSLKNCPTLLSSFAMLKKLQICIDFSYSRVALGDLLPLTLQQLSISVTGRLMPNSFNFARLENLSSLSMRRYPNVYANLVTYPINLVYLDLDSAIDIQIIKTMPKGLLRLSCSKLECHVSDLPRQLEHLAVSWQIIFLSASLPPPNWSRLDYLTIMVHKDILPFHLPATITELNPSNDPTDIHGCVPKKSWLQHDNKSLWIDYGSDENVENGADEIDHIEEMDDDGEQEENLLVDYNSMVVLSVFDLAIQPTIIRPSIGLNCFDKIVVHDRLFLKNLVHLDLILYASLRSNIDNLNFDQLKQITTMRMTWEYSKENSFDGLVLPCNLRHFQLVCLHHVDKSFLPIFPSSQLITYSICINKTDTITTVQLDWLKNASNLVLEQLNVVACYQTDPKNSNKGIVLLSHSPKEFKNTKTSLAIRPMKCSYHSDTYNIFAHEFNSKHLRPWNEWGFKNAVLAHPQSTALIHK